MIVRYILLLLLLGGCFKDSANPSTDRQEKFDFLGQEVPGDTATVFAPRIVSLKGRKEGNARFSHDGHHFYFIIADDTSLAVMTMRKQEASWSDPELFAPLLKDGYSSWEPFITAGDQEMLFVSNRSPGSPPWNGRN